MYQSLVENWGDSRFIATTRHSSFVTDTQSNGSKGANAVDTLLAAFASCIGHHVRVYFQHKGSPIAAFRVSAETDAAPDAPRIPSIAVRIDLGGVKLTTTEQAGLFAEVEKCKIYGTLRQACRVDVVVVNGEAHPLASSPLN